jgi:hypothetical protein
MTKENFSILKRGFIVLGIWLTAAAILTTGINFWKYRSISAKPKYAKCEIYNILSTRNTLVDCKFNVGNHTYNHRDGYTPGMLIGDSIPIVYLHGDPSSNMSQTSYEKWHKRFNRLNK